MGTKAERVCRRTDEGIVLAVRLTPKSSHDEISDVVTHDGKAVLKARVRALPDKGKANAALVKLIAKWLGQPASKVTVASGGKSRLKSVSVEGDSKALFRAFEEQL